MENTNGNPEESAGSCLHEFEFVARREKGCLLWIKENDHTAVEAWVREAGSGAVRKQDGIRFNAGVGKEQHKEITIGVVH